MVHADGPRGRAYGPRGRSARMVRAGAGMENRGDSRADTSAQAHFVERVVFIRLMSHDTRTKRMAPAGDKSPTVLAQGVIQSLCHPTKAFKPLRIQTVVEQFNIRLKHLSPSDVATVFDERLH